jgi:hypothetical protein
MEIYSSENEDIEAKHVHAVLLRLCCILYRSLEQLLSLPIRIDQLLWHLFRNLIGVGKPPVCLVRVACPSRGISTATKPPGMLDPFST